MYSTINDELPWTPVDKISMEILAKQNVQKRSNL